MIKYFNQKVVLGIISTIVLGALGSGLWELLKPLLGWLWDAVIAVSTLGLESLRNGLYAEAGSQFFDPIKQSSGIDFLITLVLLLLAMVFNGLAAWLLVMRQKRMVVPALKAVVLAKYASNFNLISFLVISLLLGIFSVMTGFSAVRSTYVDGLKNHFFKLEVIAAPHMTDLELKKRRAAFVQVRNRDEYLEQVGLLTKTIEASGDRVPVRTFF